MGLFSSKKIISVSSTLYSMSGTDEDSTDYLKATLYASVISNSDSIADDLTKSYFSGPGMKQKNFFNYSVRNSLAGLPSASIETTLEVDPDVIKNHIPIASSPSGMINVVQSSEITNGDPEAFFERWVLSNYPERNSEDWLGEVDHLTGTFHIQFPNGDYYSFQDSSYSSDKRYITASYFQILENNTQPLQEGLSVTVSTQQDVSSFSLVSQSGTTQTITLSRIDDVTEEWSDSTPTNTYQQNADVSGTLNRSVDTYEKTDLIGVSGLEIEGLFTRLTYTGSDVVVGGYSNTVVTQEDMGGGVTKTTTTVTSGEQINIQWDEKEDTQEILEYTVINNLQIFIYEIGTGNTTLDALASENVPVDFQEFYPFLPLRIDNKSLSDSEYVTNGLYEETKKAYRRASDSKNIDDILDEIEDNESIEDIDYAYITYGVPLNTDSDASKKYAFKFMEKLTQFQNSTQSNISLFQTSINDYTNALADLLVWENTDWDSVDWEDRIDPPELPNLTIPEASSIVIKSQSSLMPSFDIRIQWNHIEIDQITGVFDYDLKDGNFRSAEEGELQFVKGPTITWEERVGLIEEDVVSTSNSRDNTLESMIMYWQVSSTEYKRITVYGMKHFNFIYGGKYVSIGTDEALDDTEISGFLFPLHQPTLKELSIVDYTQIATENVFILFNSYQVTKQKWYQSGIFKVFLVVFILIVAVIINPTAFSAGTGILGSNVAVGTALGLTGTAALVSGVVANYLAAVVVSQLLTQAGNELFGEKWGALFAAISSFAIGVSISGTQLFSAQNLLNFGNVLANGYSGFVQGEISELNETIEQEREEYEEQMEYINDLMDGLGGNDLNFNPLYLTDSVNGNDFTNQSRGYTPETSDEFIQRTTMVGSDIVEITFSMVYDYVDVAKTLPKN